MPKLVSASPKYRRHRASGQAVVTLDSREFYLGPWGTQVSKKEYDRLIGEWLANGRRLPVDDEAEPLTVSELVLAYWRRCEVHYRQDDKPSSELGLVKLAVRPLNAIYGDTAVEKFGPLALKAIRQSFIDANVSRGVINSHITRIKRMFRWAVENEMASPTVYQALAAVAGLQRGRSEARETAPVLPVSDVDVEQTIRHLPKTIADLVRFQRLTGSRPMEACIIRPCDIDQSPDVWEYRPVAHKTLWRGKSRIIFIGPKAQAILRPYLVRESAAFCFVPSESEESRNSTRRQNRKSKMTPSQSKRKKKSNRVRPPGDHYTTASYRRSIKRACLLTWPAPESLDPEMKKIWIKKHQWHPNQLRHSEATQIRKQFGLEAAQVTMGHSGADVTQIYAERDMTKAVAVMREVG